MVGRLLSQSFVGLLFFFSTAAFALAYGKTLDVAQEARCDAALTKQFEAFYKFRRFGNQDGRLPYDFQSLVQIFGESRLSDLVQSEEVNPKFKIRILFHYPAVFNETEAATTLLTLARQSLKDERDTTEELKDPIALQVLYKYGTKKDLPLLAKFSGNNFGIFTNHLADRARAAINGEKYVQDDAIDAMLARWDIEKLKRNLKYLVWDDLNYLSQALQELGHYTEAMKVWLYSGSEPGDDLLEFLLSRARQKVLVALKEMETVSAAKFPEVLVRHRVERDDLSFLEAYAQANETGTVPDQELVAKLRQKIPERFLERIFKTDKMDVPTKRLESSEQNSPHLVRYKFDEAWTENGERQVQEFSLSPGGDHALIVTSNIKDQGGSSIWNWNLQGYETPEPLDPFSGNIIQIQTSPDGFYFATAVEGEGVLVRRFAERKYVGEVVSTIDFPDDELESIRQMAFSYDGRYLAISAKSGVYVYDLYTQKLISKLLGEDKSGPLVFSRDNKQLFVSVKKQINVLQPNQLLVWNFLDEEPQKNCRRIRTGGANILQIVSSSDGKSLALVDDTGMIRTVDIATGHEILMKDILQNPHDSILSYVAFGYLGIFEKSRGRWRLTIVDPESGETIKPTPLGEQDHVIRASFSSDGTRFAVISDVGESAKPEVMVLHLDEMLRPKAASLDSSEKK